MNHFAIKSPYKYGSCDKLSLTINSPGPTYCSCRGGMMFDDAVERSKTSQGCRFSVTNRNQVS